MGEWRLGLNSHLKETCICFWQLIIHLKWLQWKFLAEIWFYLTRKSLGDINVYISSHGLFYKKYGCNYIRRKDKDNLLRNLNFSKFPWGGTHWCLLKITSAPSWLDVYSCFELIRFFKTWITFILIQHWFCSGLICNCFSFSNKIICK